MIHYQLRCAAGHEFDGWFRDSAAFETQAAQNLVECPSCGGTDVSRALMTPSVPRKANARPLITAEPAAPPPPEPPAADTTLPVMPEAPQTAVAAPPALPAEMRAALQRLRAEVEKNCDYVGENFAEEARRIKRGDADQRGIYGETTPDEAEALKDEGIDIAAIPWLPRADG